MIKPRKKKCSNTDCHNLTYGKLCTAHEAEKRLNRAKNNRNKLKPVKIKKSRNKKTKKVDIISEPIKIKYPKLSTLKKHAWDIMSIYIRLRDSDDKGFGKCCTCENICYFFNDCFQAGHFRSRKYISVFLNEKNVNGQCRSCNGYGNGMTYEYGIFLDNKYGEGTAEELRAMEKVSVNYKGDHYINEIISFSNKAKHELSLKKLTKVFRDKINDKIDFYIRFISKYVN